MRVFVCVCFLKERQVAGFVNIPTFKSVVASDERRHETG